MNFKRKQEGDTLTVAISGRIDTATAPELDADIKPRLDGVKLLVLDFAEVNYISSAGLRLLLSLQKIMTAQGGMKVLNVNESVNDVFEVTGFDEILDYELAS